MNVVSIVLTLLLSLSSAAMAEQGQVQDKQKVKEGLHPEEARAIQAVGQAVLAAKHSQQQNPDVVQLRRHIDELRDAVEENYQLVLIADKGSVTVLTPAEVQAKKGQAAEDPAAHPKRRAAQSRLDAALGKSRQHRVAMEGKIAQSPGAADEPFLANIVIKVKELEDEIEQLGKSSERERPGKLRRLAQQLTIASAHPMETPRDVAPTISTISEHRR